MICPKCQMNIKDDARICVHCGMQFNNVQSVEVQKPSLVCPSCNSQIDSGLKFCTNCGADLSSVQVNSTPVVQSTPVINNENDRDRYLRAYFGKNYDSVMKSDFSIGTFFFGWLWLLLYGLFKPALNLFLICLGISFTTSLISVFIGGGKIFSLIGLVIQLYIVYQYANNFTAFRLDKANTAIDEVLRTVQDENERLVMCEKKGKSWILN